mmetsp:Transcript_1282/g.2802  ORF Transcript_1282/g.2802 Transcript_1282/m.2802 type:complete len:212 (+) Transcript_1282:1928-2563(+)
MAESVNIPRKTLFSSTLTELCFELVNLTHTDITSFAHLNILFESNLTSADSVVVTSEDILGKVDSLRTLTDSSAGDEEKLIKDVRVTIVKSNAEWLRQNTLSECNKGCFLQCHIVGQRADTASENVLAQSKNGSRHRSVPLREFLQSITHLEGFLKVSFLVHVDSLDKFSTGENHSVVLVLWLSFSKNRVSGQAYAVNFLNLAISIALYQA